MKEFVGKWQDNGAVAGDLTHTEMKGEGIVLGQGRVFGHWRKIQPACTAQQCCWQQQRTTCQPSRRQPTLPTALPLACRHCLTEAISELGRFYQAKGPRARLDTPTRDSILAHLAAVEAGLPEEEKSLLGF